MVARIAPDPILASTHSLADFRSRHVTGEHALLQDSTPSAHNSPDSGDGRLPDPQPQADAEPVEPALPPGAMFAAAVIAGALAPRPQTLEEVYARIGSAWIPPESELQLRDFAV
ncbi:MAG TPA: hypothetical protein VL133_13210 [Devosia sp.]|nr:hypothetical protein [Devosia sp.]